MNGTMRALRKMKAGPGLEMQQVPIPGIKANEVLIKVHKRAICGTDLHIYKWDEWSQKRIKPPVTTGHEFYGEIVEAGADVSHYQVGDLVTAEMHVVCNQCFQCRTGNAHLCENVVILGVDGDGCFADYLAVPEFNLWRVPAGIEREFAAIYDPFGNAVHTVMAGATVGKSFLILGGGPIGIAAVPVSKAAGASLVALSEVQEFRRNWPGTWAPTVSSTRPRRSRQDRPRADRRPGFRRGAGDVRPPHSHRSGVCLHPQKRALLPVGYPGQAGQIDLATSVIFSGITIQGINGRRMFDTWYQMDALLVSGKVDLKPLLTHHFKLEDYKQAFETGLSGNAGKIILE